MNLNKEKLKEYALSSVRFIAGVYYVIIIMLIALLVVSHPTLSDIFTTGSDRVTTLSGRSSKIERDIVVDASLLDRSGGVTTLTKNIIEKVALKRPDWRFNVLLYHQNPELLELSSLDNVNFIMTVPQYSFFYEILFNILNCTTFGLFKDKLLQLIYYDTIFLDNKCDLFWDPNGSGAISDFEMPKITTIHDLVPIEKSEFFKKERADWIKRRFIESIKSSEKLITVSNFSKKKIQDRYGVSSDFVKVIPIRLANRLHFNLSKEDIEITLKKFDVSPQKYMVFVSQYYQSKNFERLIKAFAKFSHKKELGETTNLKLVFVGNLVYSRGEIEKFAEQYKTGNNIIFTHVVTNKELQILLSNALFFIHPSLYEGFGMPIIEAMACGIPVTCSNRSSLPEVAGDAALFFDPYNIDDIAKAIEKMATDSALRSQLSQKGLERAKLFQNTDAMTDDYVKVFEEAMKKEE